jgi:hypothetical protein
VGKKYVRITKNAMPGAGYENHPYVYKLVGINVGDVVEVQNERNHVGDYVMVQPDKRGWRLVDPSQCEPCEPREDNEGSVVFKEINWRKAALAPDKIVSNMERHQRKTIKYTDHFGKEQMGYVAGCSYEIGFTIHGVLEDGEPDETVYVHCLIGPKGKNSEDYPHEQSHNYPQAMAAVDRMMEEGRLDVDILSNILKIGGSSHNASAETCPF